MNYLYHWVPKDMTGNILYPLNTLKYTFPEVYAQQAQKYIGREHIMEQHIPLLDCLWNDVLHFSAVCPEEIKQALEDAGLTKKYDLSYFMVDPHTLDPDKTIVYLYKYEKVDYEKADNFVSFDPNTLEAYSHLPQKTKDYYSKMIAQEKNPLLFHGVPHILYKGALDISNIERKKL